MPTVLRIGPYWFHFYSRENDELPHIHVARDDFEAKFWLRPMALAVNHGCRTTDLKGIERLADANRRAGVALVRNDVLEFRVERATGPFCRATHPTVERTERPPNSAGR